VPVIRALESLDWMRSVANEADAVFSSYDSDSAAFCDYFPVDVPTPSPLPMYHSSLAYVWTEL
jgi:hypothetical protein